MPRLSRPSPPPVVDALFDTLAAWQGDRPWGRVLDAGTGEHSLRWLLGQAPERVTAVTGARPRQVELQRDLGQWMLPSDRILVGNWADPELLRDEVFEVVLADYLLGAMDGFAPYFQDRLFARLRPHVGGRLYAVGLAPYPDSGGGEAGDLIREIARLRDACILLAGHRCYREYPLDWVQRHVAAAGLRVLRAESRPIVYRERFVDGQLDVCLQKLPLMADRAVAEALRGQVESLRLRARAACNRLDGLRFGEDWLLEAAPT